MDDPLDFIDFDDVVQHDVKIKQPSEAAEIMPTDQLNDFLRQLCLGKLDAANPAFPDNLSASDFLKEVHQLVVAMGSGHKLDKMPDGWGLKAIKRRSTVLSEAFLRARGWQFDRLQPFAIRSAQ